MEDNIGIDPVQFDDFVLDCANAALALEIQRQENEAQKRRERNTSLSLPPPKPKPINPYAQDSFLFNDEGPFRNKSFGVSVFSPDEEVPFRMDYGEASPCELHGECGIPRKVWLHTTVHHDGGKFFSFSLDSVDQDIFSKKPSPRFSRKFQATRFGEDIHGLYFCSGPDIFAALNAKITPQLNKCLTSARDLMAQYCGVDRIRDDTRLRERLEHVVVKQLPISTTEMRMIADRSFRRGRIDFPNILDASLPHMLVDEVRAILARACKCTF